MHRAGTVTVDRKTAERPTLHIRRAACSVIGGIQPGVLARVMTADFLDAGLAARLWMAMPAPSRRVWTETVVPVEVEQAYEALLDKLLALEFDQDGDEQIPHVLPLSQDGKVAWIEFFGAWADELAAVEGELAAALSKLEAGAARFALLHHVVSRLSQGQPDLGAVGRESVEAGVALAHWFAHEARRIYSLFGESEEDRHTRRLVTWVRGRGGKVTVKELQRSHSRKYATADAAERDLAALVEAGLGVWVDRPAGPRGGRPTRDFILLPTKDETDDTPSDGDDDDLLGRPPSPDETASPLTKPPADPGNSGEKQGCVGFVFRRPEDNDEPGDAQGPSVLADGLVGPGGVSSEGGEVLPDAPPDSEVL
jgi:hypothetical protein